MDSLQLIQVSGYEEPLVVDTELAERLGYSQARDIRKIIDRLKKTSVLPDVYMRATVARISKPNGGVENRTVNEYLLTEEQALMVVVKSETPRAIELTRAIIQVFQAWRKGQLTQSTQPDNALVRQLTDALAIINNRLVEVERAVILNSETITKAEYNAIKRSLATVAQLHMAAGRYKTAKAAQAAVAWRLFSVLGWVGTGQRHHLLPRNLAPRAWARLEELKRDAERVLSEVAQSKQQELLRGM